VNANVIRQSYMKDVPAGPLVLAICDTTHENNKSSNSFHGHMSTGRQTICLEASLVEFKFKEFKAAYEEQEKNKKLAATLAQTQKSETRIKSLKQKNKET